MISQIIVLMVDQETLQSILGLPDACPYAYSILNG